MTEQSSKRVRGILTAADDGDPTTAEKLLPLVYEELRVLARQMMADEPPGHTLQPTALVHQAYLRLVGDENVRWRSRGHFFRAAAEAMRRILVERARRYRRLKHGGERVRIPLDEAVDGAGGQSIDLLALDEALTKLCRLDRRKSDIVSLRYFAGLTVEETAKALGIAARTVKSEWRCAKARLYRELGGGGSAVRK